MRMSGKCWEITDLSGLFVIFIVFSEPPGLLHVDPEDRVEGHR